MHARAGAALRAGQREVAERLLRAAAECQPAPIAVHADLASLLCSTGRADEAIARLDREITRHPGAIWPLSLKCGVLTAERRTEESLPLHEALVARAPAASVPWMNYAQALAALGRAADAVAAYRTALRLDPGNGAAWWGLANLRTVPLAAEDIEAMETAFPRVREPFLQVQMLFALGKAWADQARFERSFDCYRRANALRGTLVPYDPDRTRRLVDALEAAYADARFIPDGAYGGRHAEAPIFVVGMPRSGSTLVEQILASHPMVEGAGELPELPAIADELLGGQPLESLPRTIDQLDPVTLRTLGERYLERTRRHRHSGRPRFVDKLPANWQLVALIRLILPGARIVALRRDPVACCVSAFRTCFNRAQPFPASLGDLARYHNDYLRMLACVRRIMPGQVYELHYERLVQAPEAEVRRLLAWLGLGFEPACLRFHQTRRAVHTPSALQVRRPIDRSALDHWRNYEPWLGPLLAALAPVP